MGIKQLGFSDTDFDKLVQHMHKLVAAVPNMLSTARVLDSGTMLYRGTNHHISVPTRIEDIWYPPANCIRNFGRANPPGVPMFYCCSAPVGAFAELGVGIGQYAVLATWTSTKRMLFHEIGYSDKVLRRAGSTRSLHQRNVQFAHNLPHDVRKIRDFLELAFTDPTVKHYRITAAIAQMCLAGDDIVGIIYPAVARSGNVDNLSLLPEFVHSGLMLTAAQVLHVDNITKDLPVI